MFSHHLHLIPSWPGKRSFAFFLAVILLLNDCVPARAAFAAPIVQRNVIYVQDIHGNPVAQAAISALVRTWIGGKGVGVIGLEGAFSDIDLDVFRSFPYPESLRSTADYFLKNKLMSGAVHGALISEAARVPRIVGVDDRVHYNANVGALRNAAPRRRASLDLVRRARLNVNARKAVGFHRRLREFDAQAEAYAKQDLAPTDYIESILAVPGFSRPSDLPEIEKIIAAQQLLDCVSPEQYKSQIASLVGSFAGKLTAAELSALERRDGDAVLALIESHPGVDVSRFPAVAVMLRYRSRVAKIDAAELTDELVRLEQAVYDHLIQSPSERRLIEASVYVRLAEKLVDFSLSSAEWESYRRLSPKFKSLIPSELSAFESFYVEAEARNVAIARNLIDAMEKERASVSILVTGGFHTRGVRALLDKQGIHSTVVIPDLKNAKLEKGNAYLAAFFKAPSVFERFFKRANTFLSEHPFEPEDKEAMKAVLIARAALKGRFSQAEINRLVALLKGDFNETVVASQQDGFVEFRLDGPDGPFLGKFRASTTDIEDMVLTSPVLNPLSSDPVKAKFPDGTFDEVHQFLLDSDEPDHATNFMSAYLKAIQQYPELQAYAEKRKQPLQFRIVQNHSAVASLEGGVIVIDERLLEFPRLLNQELHEEFHHLRSRIILGASLANMPTRVSDELWVTLNKVRAFYNEADVEKKAQLIANIIQGKFEDFGIHKIFLATLDRKIRTEVLAKLRQYSLLPDRTQRRALTHVPYLFDGLDNFDEELVLRKIVDTVRHTEMFTDLKDYFGSNETGIILSNFHQHRHAVDTAAPEKLLGNSSVIGLGKGVEFLQSLDTVYIPSGAAEFERMFADKEVVIVEPHADDAAISMGMTLRQLVKVRAELMFLSALPDHQGVDDAFFGGRKASDQERQDVRMHEGERYMDALVLERARFRNLGLSLDLLEKEKFESEDITPEDELPTFKDPKHLVELDTTVKLNRSAGIWFVPYPFSKNRRHPHHVVISLAFLRSIMKWNPQAQIIFYETRESLHLGTRASFSNEMVTPNLVIGFNQREMDEKKADIQVYRSQVERVKYHEEIEITNREYARIESKARGVNVGPYVERFLVGLVRKPENKTSPLGLWPGLIPFYKSFRSVVVGLAIVPSIIESGLFVGGLTVGGLLVVGVSVNFVNFAIASLPFLILWQAGHGRETFVGNKNWITLTTLFSLGILAGLEQIGFLPLTEVIEGSIAVVLLSVVHFGFNLSKMAPLSGEGIVVPRTRKNLNQSPPRSREFSDRLSVARSA